MIGQKTALPNVGPGPRAASAGPLALFAARSAARLRRVLPALALFAGLTLGPAPCLAHAVYVFAWTEADRICSESYFSKKSKVRGGRVEVYDPEGTLLASGTSDEAGRLCFARPQSSGDLLFVVNAGQGHRGEFLLPAGPASAAASAAASTAAPTPAPASPSAPVQDPSPASAPAPAPDPASASAPAPDAAPASARPSDQLYAAADLEALIRATVRDEVRRELEPLRRALVEKGGEGGPTFREVLGGLGWIAGLAGFGAWYAARRRER